MPFLEKSILTIEDEPVWNDFLLTAYNASYRAAMNYEYFKRSTTSEPVTCLFKNEGKNVVGAHYLIKNSSLNLIRTGDVDSGLIINENFEQTDIDESILHFLEWGKQKDASFLRINPWVPEQINGSKTRSSDILSKCLNKYGFLPLKEGRKTYWIDLKQEESFLLAKMRRKTRYEIKKGIESGIQIHKIIHVDENIISRFWEFYCTLGRIKRFALLSENRFKNEIRILLNSGFGMLFSASYKDEIINISLASCKGIASYMYGAMNPDIKLKGQPAPGHFVQWSMIKTMKDIGLKTYDMGFCPGNLPQEEHPEFNIWHFKYGFGGDYVQFMPVYGKILKPFTGRLFRIMKY